MPTKDQARQTLQQLIQKYQRLSEKDRKDLSEADVVHQFIEPLLETVLGWNIQDVHRYRKELHTQAGRPDIALYPENTGVIYVEAKKFGRIAELEHARRATVGTLTPPQMALPGMAVDRTIEEQQAINYAFANAGTWAVLTNFEKLRLFNARRDWLVLSFETPGDYLATFDYLWQLSYEEVTAGSLDRLSNQRHREEVDTNYLAFINTWREKLARDIVAHPVTNAWAFLPDGTIDLPLLRDVVQRFLDRLVIIRFAEDHLVIPPGSLYSLYETSEQHAYTFSMDEFVDRFFRRFDEQHNSALFAPGVVDEASFSDDVLKPLIQKLYEARYRAMSADILGNTYEQYLGKALVLDNGSVSTRDNLETRKKQGSYYTPQVIVRYIVDNSLGRYLYGTANGKPDGESLPDETRKTSRDIQDLHVFDSACGSGSFLIYAYYVLADFYQREMERLNQVISQTITSEAAAGKDRIDIEIAVAGFRAEQERIRDYRTLILEHHLYGTDLDPQAAEIAVVNLIMRAMEQQGSKKRLPLILNQNVKVGNALIGVRPDDSRMERHAPALAELRRLRRDLIQTLHTDPRYHPLQDEIRTQTAALYATFEPDFAAHFSDLERVRPFHPGIEFPEVFYDEQGRLKENPGFTVIFGNPPWEILKPDLREFYAQFDEQIESQMNRSQVEQRIEELAREDPRRPELYAVQTKVVEKMTTWLRRSSDYIRQGRGDVATHKLFLERMYGLLRREGRLGYVVPSGIYTDLGTKDLREMLLNEGNIQYIYSFSNERFFFPGVDHRFKFCLIGVQKGQQTKGFWAAFRFNPRVAVAPGDLPAFLANRENLVYVRRDSLARFSPDSLSVMEFQTQREYEIAEKIYGKHPVLGQTLENCWNVKFTREFDKTNDRELFNTRGQGLPIFEGENLGFYGENLRPPTIWIDEDSGRAKLISPLRRQAPNLPIEQIPLDYKHYRFGFRRISNATNERTLYVSYLPKNAFAMYTLTTTVKHFYDGEAFKPYMSDKEEMFLYSCMASFVLDFIMRFQVSSSVAMFNAYSLPVPRLTAGNPFFDALVPHAAKLTCTRPEFATLWQEVMSGTWNESSGTTDPAERQKLRNEIDAIVANLYGLSRSDFAHILTTFPLVFPDMPAGRLKHERLLDVFDEWERVTRGWSQT